MNRSLRIAIIGARGINNYGGFETFVGKLGPGLVEKGYEVFCSQEKNVDDERGMTNGVKVIDFPLNFPKNYVLRKLFENLYDWYFVVKCTLSLRSDVIYCLASLSGIAIILPRLYGRTTIVNIDGLEWRRKKFNWLEKSLIKVLFLCSCANSTHIIIDNSQLRQYIPERFKTKAKFISYGVSPLKSQRWDILMEESLFKEKIMNVKPLGYWLVVARLEPENNIEMIVEGYLKSASQRPIIIVGDFTSEKYNRLVMSLIHDRTIAERIVFLGSICNQSHLGALREHCLAYVHGHSVGGTNPSLLEAMSARNIIIAHDNPFNREVGSESALYFSNADDLSHAIQQVEQNAIEFSDLREHAGRRAVDNYGWKRIISEYDTLLKTVILESDR